MTGLKTPMNWLTNNAWQICGTISAECSIHDSVEQSFADTWYITTPRSDPCNTILLDGYYVTISCSDFCLAIQTSFRATISVRRLIHGQSIKRSLPCDEYMMIPWNDLCQTVITDCFRAMIFAGPSNHADSVKPSLTGWSTRNDSVKRSLQDGQLMIPRKRSLPDG